MHLSLVTMPRWMLMWQNLGHVVGDIKKRNDEIDIFYLNWVDKRWSLFVLHLDTTQRVQLSSLRDSSSDLLKH